MRIVRRFFTPFESEVNENGIEISHQLQVLHAGYASRNDNSSPARFTTVPTLNASQLRRWCWSGSRSSLRWRSRCWWLSRSS